DALPIWADVGPGVEVGHLAGEPDRVLGRVEQRDGPGRAAPGEQPVPEVVDRLAERRLDPDAGDDDAPPPPVVGRRTGPAGRARHALAAVAATIRSTASPTAVTSPRPSSPLVMSRAASGCVTSSTGSGLSASRSSASEASAVTWPAWPEMTSTGALVMASSAAARSMFRCLLAVRGRVGRSRGQRPMPRPP